MSDKQKITLFGDVPGGQMRMFKDSSMKYVACLVMRFLELSPNHSMEDFNNVRVFENGYFISLQEDIEILNFGAFGNSVKIQLKPQEIKLED